MRYPANLIAQTKERGGKAGRGAKEKETSRFSRLSGVAGDQKAGKGGGKKKRNGMRSRFLFRSQEKEKSGKKKKGGKRGGGGHLVV